MIGKRLPLALVLLALAGCAASPGGCQAGASSPCVAADSNPPPPPSKPAPAPDDTYGYAALVPVHKGQ